MIRRSVANQVPGPGRRPSDGDGAAGRPLLCKAQATATGAGAAAERAAAAGAGGGGRAPPGGQSPSAGRGGQLRGRGGLRGGGTALPLIFGDCLPCHFRLLNAPSLSALQTPERIICCAACLLALSRCSASSLGDLESLVCIIGKPQGIMYNAAGRSRQAGILVRGQCRQVLSRMPGPTCADCTWGNLYSLPASTAASDLYELLCRWAQCGGRTMTSNSRGA